MIVALRVTKGQSKPSDFVFFITYLSQVRTFFQIQMRTSTHIFTALWTVEQHWLLVSLCQSVSNRHGETAQAP